MRPIDGSCRNYILFLSDVLRTRDVLGPQTRNRVIIISRSSQWKQQEFLASKASSDIVNLLVIGESLSVDVKKVASDAGFWCFDFDRFSLIGTALCDVHASPLHWRPRIKCTGRSYVLDQRTTVTATRKSVSNQISSRFCRPSLYRVHHTSTAVCHQKGGKWQCWKCKHSVGRLGNSHFTVARNAFEFHIRNCRTEEFTGKRVRMRRITGRL